MEELAKLSEKVLKMQFTENNAADVMISWDVETDRGPHHFDMRDRDDVRLVAGNRLLIIDADGNRYEVPDYSRLDSRSRGILEQLL